MTQSSMFWTTNGTGDGNYYTQTNWFQFIARMFQTDATTQGVIAAFANELSVGVDGANLVVETGGAIVAGIPYQNDAAVNLTPTVPAGGTGDTGGFVGLRADFVAQTVRAFLKQTTDGVPSPPPVVQSFGTVWEIRLSDYTIATDGTITLGTDRREFLEYPNASIYRRFGGDANDWSTIGITSRKAGFPRIQCGSVRWTGAAATSGSLNVSLSTTGFLNKGIPIIMAQQGNKVVSGSMSAYDTLVIDWFERDGVSTSTAVDFYFVILGPGNV